MSGTPPVSVIIPAYNQAQYLGIAVQSVLAQTCQDFEVIVVDDGSGDDTARVARQYGDRLRYIWQANQGLAGARNTGLRAATGTYVALLDSDDEWLPGHLDSMLALAHQYPHAAVFYCQARCMDGEGHDLDQLLGGPARSPESMYTSLLRANFLIPSTVLIHRATVVAAGAFDQSLRSCEDWDLWLRLLPGHRFIGSPSCQVRYRVHGASLSTRLEGMHRAARAVIYKHFGDETGQPQDWGVEKRTAYAGLYAYQALTSVLRQDDWSACARYLGRALHIDSGTGTELGLFYDLALGSQPVGYRGTGRQLELQANARHMSRMLSEVFAMPALATRTRLRRQTLGTANLALGLVAYNTGQTALCRRYLLKAIYHRPDLLRSRLAVGDLLKSFVARALISKLGSYRRSALSQAQRVPDPGG